VASLEQTAVGAAAGEAGLRNGLRQVFVSLARRNQSLLQRQLRLIDTLEQKASDPAALADLFALDHLTTPDAPATRKAWPSCPGRRPGGPGPSRLPIIDVIRAAMAEVEDYRRVDGPHRVRGRGGPPPAVADHDPTCSPKLIEKRDHVCA